MRTFTTSFRSGLGFAQLAREAFAFVHQFGFRETSAEDTIVRYLSDRAFLNVYHGRSSYEIGLELGTSDSAQSDTPGHSMSALIRLQDPEQAAHFRNVTATTPEEVSKGLYDLAEKLKAYGEPALQGDVLFFGALDRQRQEWARAFAADVAYRQILPHADASFRQGDYQKAAELYGKIRSKLSPAELKKLEYAKKQT